jgi:predicted methyltransferase
MIESKAEHLSRWARCQRSIYRSVKDLIADFSAQRRQLVKWNEHSEKQQQYLSSIKQSQSQIPVESPVANLESGKRKDAPDS